MDPTTPPVWDINTEGVLLVGSSLARLVFYGAGLVYSIIFIYKLIYYSIHRELLDRPRRSGSASLRGGSSMSDRSPTDGGGEQPDEDEERFNDEIQGGLQAGLDTPGENLVPLQGVGSKLGYQGEGKGPIKGPGVDDGAQKGWSQKWEQAGEKNRADGKGTFGQSTRQMGGPGRGDLKRTMSQSLEMGRDRANKTGPPRKDLMRVRSVSHIDKYSSKVALEGQGVGGPVMGMEADPVGRNAFGENGQKEMGYRADYGMPLANYERGIAWAGYPAPMGARPQMYGYPRMPYVQSYGLIAAPSSPGQQYWPPIYQPRVYPPGQVSTFGMSGEVPDQRATATVPMPSFPAAMPGQMTFNHTSAAIQMTAQRPTAAGHKAEEPTAEIGSKPQYSPTSVPLDAPAAAGRMPSDHSAMHMPPDHPATTGQNPGQRTTAAEPMPVYLSAQQIPLDRPLQPSSMPDNGQTVTSQPEKSHSSKINHSGTGADRGHSEQQGSQFAGGSPAGVGGRGVKQMSESSTQPTGHQSTTGGAAPTPRDAGGRTVTVGAHEDKKPNPNPKTGTTGQH